MFDDQVTRNALPDLSANPAMSDSGGPVETPETLLVGDGEATLTAALKAFGWECGPVFWQRYYGDPWVFNLANAVERLTEHVRRLEHLEILDDHEVCDEQLRAANAEIERLRALEVGPSEEEIEAARRIAKFCDEYEKMGGLDPENVYRLHLGSDVECGVTISDLRLLVAARSVRSPKSEEQRSEWVASNNPNDVKWLDVADAIEESERTQ